MAISITDIKTGMALVINGGVWVATEVNHVKPGKGAAFVRTRLKNLKTDLVQERTFRNSDRIEEGALEERKLQYQYNAGDDFHFMDLATYEEVTINRDQLGGAVNFLQDNMPVMAVCFRDKVQKVIVPNFIVTQISESEPGVKGDSSKAGTKPARIDTGATIQVPLFVNAGDWIKLDTRDGQGQYVERVQK